MTSFLRSRRPDVRRYALAAMAVAPVSTPDVAGVGYRAPPPIESESLGILRIAPRAGNEAGGAPGFVGAATGAELGENDLRITDVYDDAEHPAVAYDPANDQYLVVFDARKFFLSLHEDVFGQLRPSPKPRTLHRHRRRRSRMQGGRRPPTQARRHALESPRSQLHPRPPIRQGSADVSTVGGRRSVTPILHLTPTCSVEPSHKSDVHPC